MVFLITLISFIISETMYPHDRMEKKREKQILVLKRQLTLFKASRLYVFIYILEAVISSNSGYVMTSKLLFTTFDSLNASK